jgi:AbrB family looped-hinge helix DNA binding protein
MAHQQEIVRVDSKGRVTIPAYMREELGMHDGSYASVRIDRESQTISVGLFAGPGAKLVQMKMVISDRPGALARIARTLSELNLDLLISNSRTIRKGELAEWVVVADFAGSAMTIEDVKRKLLANKDATVVETKEMAD